MFRIWLKVSLCMLVCLGLRADAQAIAQQQETSSDQDRVLLLLKRDDAQRAEMDKVLADLQDPHSSSYHKWLTPEEIGRRFGPSDAQIERIRRSLAAHGLVLSKVHPGRFTVEVTGTQDELRHTFTVSTTVTNGQPSARHAIPSELGDLVESVVTGRKRPVVAPGATKINYDRKQHMFLRPPSGTAEVQNPNSEIHPLMTVDNGGIPFYGVTPGDLAIQYGLPSYVQGSGTTIKGAGVGIGVISDYNVNLSYVSDYGTTFGITLPYYGVIVDGQDPGVFGGPTPAYFELEAIGAIAPSATVVLYTAAGDSGSLGTDFALSRAITDDLVNVLLYPYSTCEAANEDEASFLSTFVEFAAIEGMTVITPAGDVGSAACDQQFGDAASNGLAVNAPATSPFVTAVGGTDFYYGAQGAATQSTYDQYWSSSATAYTTQLGYIPEQAWNDSNQATDQNAGFSYLLAGGGGINTVGFDDRGNPLGGPYPQPWWQLGVVPSSISTTARVLPDVSFFAGDYTNYSAYVFCAAGTDCANTTNQNASNLVFTEGSGTEVSAAVFAGIMGLVVGEHGPQGNVNPTLYSMSKTTDGVFNDVTYGNNSVACTSGSPNCSNGFLVDQSGQLAYTALAGYDAATGLGSINATALVQQWTPPNTSPTITTIAILNPSTKQPISSFQQGTPVNIQVTVTGTGGVPTGHVAILTDAGQDATRGQTEFPLVNGVATQPTSIWPNGYPLLPGGSYHVYARYSGDETYQSSLSSLTSLNVSKAPCSFTVFSQSIQTGASIPYGTPVTLEMEPFATTNPSDVIAATGSITVKDNGTALTTFQLESTGAGVFSDAGFLPGSHALSFAYSGDPSLQSCSLSPNLSFTVSAVPTTTTLTTSLSSIPSSTKGYYALTAVVTPSTTADQGTFPAGTVTFTRSDGLVVASGISTQGFYSGNLPAAMSTAYLGATALGVGNSSITATFTPATPSGYVASTSNNVNVTVGSSTGLTSAHLTISTADGGNVYYDTMSTLTVNVSVTGAGTPTGTVGLFANGSFVANMTPLGNAQWTYVFDSSTTSTGLLPLAPGKVTLLAQYSGDSINGTDRQPLPITILDDQKHPDYQLSTTADYKIITAGTTTATFAVQLSPVNGFSGTVSFATNKPSGTSCSIPSPGTVTLGSKQFVTTTLTCTGLPTTPGVYLIDLQSGFTIASTTPNVTTQLYHDLPFLLFVR